MSSQEILLILVFTVILITFSIWPAMKVVGFLEKHFMIKDKYRNFLTLIFTIIIAFLLSLFLKYA